MLERLGLSALLPAALPHDDARVKLAPAVAIRLVVTNLVLGREPLYGLGEWAARYDQELLGLTADEVGVLNDDRVGRSLEALVSAPNNCKSSNYCALRLPHTAYKQLG